MYHASWAPVTLVWVHCQVADLGCWLQFCSEKYTYIVRIQISVDDPAGVQKHESPENLPGLRGPRKEDCNCSSKAKLTLAASAKRSRHQLQDQS